MNENKILRTSLGTVDLLTPVVMGILNITPDSFYDGGRYQDETRWLERTGRMLEEGAVIIDVGGASTRPGADPVAAEEELERLLPAIEKISRHYPGAILSIDTYRSQVARACIAAGGHMINDISGGRFDEDMLPLVAELGVPYIMMHILGTPRDMQKDPQYNDVVAEVKLFFEDQLNKLRMLDVTDNVVIDPGFGFGKTPEHNFRLLKELSAFSSLNCPIMAGVSRKSMINRILGCRPEDALNGTTVANTIALLNGADILRVHDVKEAAEAVKLVQYMKKITKK